MVDSIEQVPRSRVVERIGMGVLGVTKRLMPWKLAKIQPEEPANSSSSSADKEYDEYGFSIPDNVFAHGIQLYEQDFSEKRERRLKRWENVEISGKWKTRNYLALKILIRKGIPNHYRQRMWFTLSGADQLQASLEGAYERLLGGQCVDDDVARQIEMDIYRTFPTNSNYTRDSEGVKRLRNVLQAFAKFVPSVGYCQSFNYLAGILLMFMDEERAFLTMVQLIDSRVPGKGMNILGYYMDGMIDLKRDVLVLEMVLKKKLKKLYNHLKNNGVEFTCICAEWFLCLFSISLPMPTLLRVWDAMMNEGDKILFRVAFALFKVHEKKLLKQDTDIMIYCKSMANGIVQHDEILKVALYNLSAFRRRDIHEMRLQAIMQVT